MVDLMENLKFFECYSCRRVLMFKSDRNTGKRKCIKNRKQILTIPEIREKKLRKNGKEKSGKMKSQTGQLQLQLQLQLRAHSPFAETSTSG
jgi:hypothetical protein